MAEELTPAASRQTSCHACARGKRGCDRRHPACSRCAEKGLHCVYAKRTYAEAFTDFASAELDVAWAEFAVLPSSPNAPGRLAPSPRLEMPLPTLDAFMDPFLGFADDHAVSPSGMQLISSAGEPLGQQQQQASEEQALSKFDYSPMADLCTNYEPWQVYDPTTKVHFIVHSLRSYPSTFAATSHTPFLHASLYRAAMPPAIRACLAACALYAAMTSANKPAVLRVLCQSLADLLRPPQSPTELVDPRERLARAQALLLYQIIGLFDGDVTLRSAADRNMPLLQEWVDELCAVREELGASLESMKETSPPTSWERWIFAESLRRTIVIAYAFLGLWSTMCQHTDATFFLPWQHRHPWSMARPLWEAPSSFAFFRAWGAHRHHVVVNFEVLRFLELGRADEVDEFARVFVVAYLGVDGTREWFAERGGGF